MPAAGQFVGAWVVANTVMNWRDTILGEIVAPSDRHCLFYPEGNKTEGTKSPKGSHTVRHINKYKVEQISANTAFFHSKLQNCFVSIIQRCC